MSHSPAGRSSYDARRTSSYRSTRPASYGPLRTSFSRESSRTDPYTMPLPVMLRSGRYDGELGTRLYISNLDYGVSDRDIGPMIVPELVMLSTGCNDRELGTKLYISNLDYGVSDRDIGILFSGVGELERYSVHYDKSGRSKGTAEVVFACHQDALASIMKYNNAFLDGKPMKIELIGADVLLPSTRVTASGDLGRPYGFARRDQESYVGRGLERYSPWGRKSYSDRGRGHGDGGSGRGQEQVRSRGEKVTAEELDADLERYRSQAKKKK